MKKIAALCILIVLLGHSAWSQPIDAPTKKLLNDVKTKYLAYSTIQIKFKYTLNDRQSDLTDENEGTLYLQKEKFRLSMDKIEIISNNKDLWMHLVDAKQVSVTNYSPELVEEEFGFSPKELFAIKEDDYLSKTNGEVSLNGVTAYEVELTPKRKDKNIFKVKMYINKSSLEIIQVMFYETDGIIYTLEFVEQIPNKVFSSNMFIFDAKKYPNVVIEDIRK